MPSGVKVPKRKKVAICIGEPMRFGSEAGGSKTGSTAAGIGTAGLGDGGSAAGGGAASGNKTGSRMAARREFSEQLRHRLQELMDEAENVR